MRPLLVWRREAAGYVKGYGARELAIAAGSRPVWSSFERAWVVAPHCLADIMALAEHQGRRVEWRGVRDAAS